jgi:hypothetical protein
MNHKIARSCGIAVMLLTPPAFGQAARQLMWYDQPAGSWEAEALPIGNGRLGAMIFGPVDKETIQINEDSRWLGDKKDTRMCQNLGEFEVDMERAKCKLTLVTLRSLTGTACQVRYGEKTAELKMKPGTVIRLRGDLSRN